VYNKEKIKVGSKIYGLLLLLVLSACAVQKNPEVAPAAENKCFPGAYYRKAATSYDRWTGISGEVILGYPTVDQTRLNQKGKPLDNFSVYMGGSANGKQEVDAGLTWEVSADANGKTSEHRNAWRPFWRVNSWNNAPNKAEFAWKPGDKVFMSVQLIGPEKMRMIIRDLNDPKKMFQVDFDANGFKPGVLTQFKRVNAIDQMQNEGKPVKVTTAKVVGSEWLNTMLYRDHKNKKYPMNKNRFTDMRCNDAMHIKVTETNSAIGAEKIDIYGTP
jgi:hypothetical protein